MFEKEKKQYAEDCKTHGRPWELWQSALANNGILNWIDLYREPNWSDHCVYRRKNNAFMPEYFSGLNWRDAEHLVGKTVECSNIPDEGWDVGLLRRIVPIGKNFDVSMNFYTYIRTCEESLKYPTINVGGVELPMPETVAPVLGQLYWLSPTAICHEWNGFVLDNYSLISGQVHLTEERAKAWEDWWKSIVIDKME